MAARIVESARSNQETTMFTKSIIALGAAAVVLTATFGTPAIAQTKSQEWWRIYQNTERGNHIQKHGCVRGEESAASSYPSWMQC